MTILLNILQKLKKVKNKTSLHIDLIFIYHRRSSDLRKDCCYKKKRMVCTYVSIYTWTFKRVKLPKKYSDPFHSSRSNQEYNSGSSRKEKTRNILWTNLSSFCVCVEEDNLKRAIKLPALSNCFQRRSRGEASIKPLFSFIQTNFDSIFKQQTNR